MLGARRASGLGLCYAVRGPITAGHCLDVKRSQVKEVKERIRRKTTVISKDF